MKKQEDIFGYFATIPALELLVVTFSAPNQLIKFLTSFLSLERLSLRDIGFHTLTTLAYCRSDLALSVYLFRLVSFGCAIPFPRISQHN